MLQIRFWTCPLVVAGTNSLALECMNMLLKGWTAQSLKTHFGAEVFRLKIAFGGRAFYLVEPTYEPMAKAVLVGTMFWLVCYWMYRQKIFVRV